VGVAFVALKKPEQRPPSTKRIESTPERLARGQYLVEHVLFCLHCHSEPNEEFFGQPPKAGTKGAGGNCWTEALGFPGHLCTPNLTADATGLGQWTDGQIMRAFREGIDRDGRALFPIMPYGLYQALSEEDARSVVVFLRTVPAVKRESPPNKLNFPLNLVVKFFPQPLKAESPSPDRKDSVAYGRYLATVSGCIECHSPTNGRGGRIAGKEFSGNEEFPLTATAAVRSSNLTPHETGLGNIDKASFIGRFKAYDHPEAALSPVAKDQNTVMPWLPYARMTPEDLGAIYDYLMTLEPIASSVQKYGAKSN
jgi:mono/diheme cytochrome c family protein